MDKATEQLLENNKSPARKLGQIDNRGSHFYLSLYWAKALSQQHDDLELQNKFNEVYQSLANNESTIADELINAQGQAVDVNGYYYPNDQIAAKAMQPSDTLNSIINAI